MLTASVSHGHDCNKPIKQHWGGILLKATVAATSIINVSSFAGPAVCRSRKTRLDNGCSSCSIFNGGRLPTHRPLHEFPSTRKWTNHNIPTPFGLICMAMDKGGNQDKSDRLHTTFSQREYEDPSPSNIFRNTDDATKSPLPLFPELGDIFEQKETKAQHPPWILSSSQIKKLKVVELRQACADRNLIKTGKKEDLQNRLMEWALEEESKKNKLEQTGIVDYRVLPLQTQKRRRNPGKERLDRLSNLLTSLNNNSSSLLFKATTKDDDDEDDEISLSVTNSTDEYLALLTKTYNTSPHTPYSNLQLTQLYNRAKVADINGDIDAAKCILTQLAEITPHDGRIVRRLARLHSSTGDITSAREILQKACSSYPENAYLWQGLANLELSLKRTGLARKYFKEAISADPDLPNSYHALGRLEHQEGNIRESMSILKKGIKHCPQNHRLYHALGNLYLEANMMKPAEEAFKKGMIYSPNWGQSFFYTSLAHVAYEMDGAIKAMDWLKKGIDLNPMHAQGWTALGELHESEGNFEEAREVYKEASNYYEKVRLKEKKMMRLGDKWRNVYINWAKMEEKAGRVSQAGEIYLKAAKVFPKDWNILTTFAIAMAKDRKRLSHTDIKSIFERACNIAGSRHANPYRQYAKYEISLSNHLRARSIFYLGAEAVAKSPDERECRDRGLDALFYDWGLLEFKYMENPDGARLLFDKALELASLDNKELRAKIYCSIGEIELRNKNYYVTKHFACLSINESENNGTKEAWSLWANVADLLEQEEMADYCREQAKIQAMKEMKFWIDDDLTAAKLMKGFNLKNMLCKTPWNKKLMYQAMEDVSYTGKLK